VNSIEQTFLEHVAESLRESVRRDGAVTSALATLAEAAGSAWPAIAGDGADFVAHVARHLPDDKPLAESLAALRVEELLLAWACARGAPRAVAALRDQHHERMRAAARRAGPEHLVDDVLQRVMTKLMVAEAGRSPAIAAYAGRGSLVAWLEVTTTREMRNAIRAEAPIRKATEGGDVDALLDQAVDQNGDGELAHLKQLYRGHFKAAFEQAFAELDPRERTLLRHEHLDGLDGAQIGALYGVHKATVSRWRAQAREGILRRTRHHLEREARLSPNELDSVMRLIQSQLHVSLTRVLRNDAATSDRNPPDVDE
jgi:RNA polymerase sigma-70 factor, ECF subfamily